MSTQINVVVGQAGLSAQAKAQTAANRQAKLEGDAQARAVALGQQQRAVQAGDEYGLVQSQRRRDEPTAFRQVSTALAHWWWFIDAPLTTTQYGAFETGLGTQLRNQGITASFPSFLGAGSGSDWEQPLLPSVPLGFTPPPSAGPVITSSSYDAPSDTTAYFGTHQFRLNWNIQHNYDMVALPCGNGAAIVVVCDRYAWFANNCSIAVQFSESGIYGRQPAQANTYFRDNNALPFGFSTTRGAHRGVSCYVCSNRSIRPISTPSALNQVLLQAWPEPTLTGQGVVTDRWLNSFQVLYSYDYYELPNNLTGVFSTESSTVSQGFLGQENGQAAVGKGYSWTPKVFEVLNGISQFINPAQIKSFPAGKRWLLADRTTGSAFNAFALNQQNPSVYPEVVWSSLYAGALPFRHARWPVAGQTPTLAITTSQATVLPRNSLTLDPGRPARTGTYGGAYNDEVFGSVWDWDDPGYCRQMCTALGFTAADFTP